MRTSQSEYETQQILSYFDEQRELLRQQWKGRINFNDDDDHDDHHEEEEESITGHSSHGNSHETQEEYEYVSGNMNLSSG